MALVDFGVGSFGGAFSLSSCFVLFVLFWFGFLGLVGCFVDCAFRLLLALSMRHPHHLGSSPLVLLLHLLFAPPSGWCFSRGFWV